MRTRLAVSVCVIALLAAVGTMLLAVGAMVSGGAAIVAALVWLGVLYRRES
ncbi:hypothetical protein [Rhodococcus rhodnii]|uniref:Uncharacterized protein n=1 Tax=Rhodococcus rhodnii LMG 5362 TaxID=1273125 RepID=R7WQU0_9NOCA|nr:hypothetical protein [Rhodococcus rhodnii]EOM76324.1 hypothetical protein Rrhod_2325 [Rhodococcus rhodnii LMG 5362]